MTRTDMLDSCFVGDGVTGGVRCPLDEIRFFFGLSACPSSNVEEEGFLKIFFTAILDMVVDLDSFTVGAVKSTCKYCTVNQIAIQTDDDYGSFFLENSKQ